MQGMCVMYQLGVHGGSKQHQGACSSPLGIKIDAL